jgi:hypothetical protein
MNYKALQVMTGLYLPPLKGGYCSIGKTDLLNPPIAGDRSVFVSIAALE